MTDGIDTFKIKYGGKKEVLFISPNEGGGRFRPDNVNFEAPADGIYLLPGYKFQRCWDWIITDPLTLTEEIYIYDPADVRTGSNFDAGEDEFFITQKYGFSSDDEFTSNEPRAGDL